MVGTNQSELIDTITVGYPFSVIVPLPGWLNSGPLHNSNIWVNAQVATIAPTDPPTITAVTALSDNSGYTVTWQAPVLAATGVTLSYNIYSHDPSDPKNPIATGQATTTYADHCAPSANNTNTIACQVPPSANYSYQVSAVQPNGMESARSDAAQS